MRITTTLLISSLIMLANRPVYAQQNIHTIKEELDTYGKIRAKITYNKDHFWDGPLTTYYPSGEIEAVRFYAPLHIKLKDIQNDKRLNLEEKIDNTIFGRVGIHTHYYPKNRIKRIEFYSYGKLHGLAVSVGPETRIDFYYDGRLRGHKILDAQGNLLKSENIDKSSVYETLRILGLELEKNLKLINNKMYWDYIYYTRLTEGLLNLHWHDLNIVGAFFYRLDKSTYKDEMSDRQKKFWKEKRDEYRALLVEKAYQPINKEDLKYIIPIYEGEILFKEFLRMIEESTDKHFRKKIEMQLEEVISNIELLDPTFLQKEELEDLKQDLLTVKEKIAEHIKEEELRSSLIEYLNEDINTLMSTDKLINKALDHELITEKMLELMASGLFEYLYNKSQKLPLEAPIKAEYDYLIIAYGGLMLNNIQDLPQDVDINKIEQMTQKTREVYDVQSSVTKTGDINKLRKEFLHKRAKYERSMVK